MENKAKKALNDFVDTPEVEEEVIDNAKKKEVILNEREGLIERVDKIYVTGDGRQLLREQY
jgi:hypothetical protein